MLRTMVGSQLDPDYPRTTISLEAKYATAWSRSLWSELSARIDRPFDKHENFAAPYAKVQISVSVDTRPEVQGDVRPFLTALALDRWNYDGARVRVGTNGVVRWQATNKLALQIEMAPWVELSKFRTSPEGRQFPGFGLTEKATLEFNLRPLFFELGLTAQQSLSNVWHNDFGSMERAGLRVTEAISLGIAHELLVARMDESTGHLRNVTLFDSRTSRLSVFGEMIL